MNLLITAVNPDVTQPREAEIVIRGATPRRVRLTVLAHSDIHAHNTFEQKNAVVPQARELKIGTPLVVTFPPASVAALNLELS